MAIKDPLQLITPLEFKQWQGFNKILFDDVTTPENEIWFAINIASSNIDYLSGFTISKKWPEDPITDWTDNIQTATAHYVRFLLTKDTDYLRGQSSMSQAGMTYSQSNPDDPYFIPPEVFNFLRKINEYNNTIKGYDLPNIKPRVSNFNNFITNDDNFPLNNYIPYNNVESLDSRTKITISHPKNMLQSVLNIDTRAIKDFNNITPDDLIKLFTTEMFEVKNQGTVGKKIQMNEMWIASLFYFFNFDKDFLSYKGLKTLNKTIVGAINEVFDNGTTDLTDYYKKEETNILLENKQNKLIAGNNITIDSNNVISATGGTTDLTDYYKKEETNILLENKLDKKQFEYAFTINTIGTEIPNLETTNKTIVGAINEVYENGGGSSQIWKEVAVSTNGYLMEYSLKNKTYYRLYHNWSVHNNNCKFGEGIYLVTQIYWVLPLNFDTTKRFIIDRKYNYFINETTATLSYTHSYIQAQYGKFRIENYSTHDDNSSGTIWKLEELQ